MALDSSNGDSMATDNPVAVEKLSVECPVHGTVPVVCPRCAGKRGGKQHKGTTWKRKRLDKDMETARRLLDILPEAKMLEQMAEERKRFQILADRLGWTKDERELLFTEMHLDHGISHLREVCDRMGLPPEERAKLHEDLQKMIAVALRSM